MAVKKCKHLRARGIWRAQEGADQLEYLVCPDCKRQWLLWVYMIAPGHVMIGYNYAPVDL